MLSLVLPKGSLERATLELFDAADLAVLRGSDRDYHASIDDPRIDRVRFLRPQEIPQYFEQGLFDLGITGRDWIAETAARCGASPSWSTRRPRVTPCVSCWPFRSGFRPSAATSFPTGSGSPPSTPSSPVGSSTTPG